MLQDFLKHQEVVNASSSQKDPYILLHKDFKLIAWPVQELWWSKVELTNSDVRSISSSSMSSTQEQQDISCLRFRYSDIMTRPAGQHSTASLLTDTPATEPDLKKQSDFGGFWTHFNGYSFKTHRKQIACYRSTIDVHPTIPH
jgi:hypothetical protein